MVLALVAFASFADAQAQESNANSRIWGHVRQMQVASIADQDSAVTINARAILALVPQLDSAARAKFTSYVLAETYRDLAGVIAGHGDARAALALLDSAPAKIAPWLEDDVERYQLVGMRAPPLRAPHWINASGTTQIDPGAGGPVTVIEMTAWWCGSCIRSYPTLASFARTYGDRVHLVLATGLLGRFRDDTALPPAVETEKLRAYYTQEEHFTCPIAVGARDNDEIATSYHSAAIPQIVVVDGHGIVRRILMGWDVGNADRLDEAIRSALGGPSATP